MFECFEKEEDEVENIIKVDSNKIFNIFVFMNLII